MIHSSLTELSICHPIILLMSVITLKRCGNISPKDWRKEKQNYGVRSISRERMDKTMYFHIISTNCYQKTIGYICICLCDNIKRKVRRSWLYDPRDLESWEFSQARIPEWVVIPFQWIFLIQESNWSLLYCRWILCQLSYQGSPEHWWISKTLCNERSLCKRLHTVNNIQEDVEDNAKLIRGETGFGRRESYELHNLTGVRIKWES